MKSFVPFRRFTSIEHAREFLINLFEIEGIPYELEESSIPAVAVIGEVGPLEKYIVKIREDDFKRVGSLLQAQAVQAVQDVDSNHYLFDFSNEELSDVVRKADEWSAFDVALARKILSDRDARIDDTQLKVLEQERLHELAQPETPSQGWIIFFFISSILGGIAGIVSGWHYWTSKKRLPNGHQVHTYDELTRDKGKTMMFVGLFFFLLTLIYRFTEFFSF